MLLKLFFLLFAFSFCSRDEKVHVEATLLGLLSRLVCWWSHIGVSYYHDMHIPSPRLNIPLVIPLACQKDLLTCSHLALWHLWWQRWLHFHCRDIARIRTQDLHCFELQGLIYITNKSVERDRKRWQVGSTGQVVMTVVEELEVECCSDGMVTVVGDKVLTWSLVTIFLVHHSEKTASCTVFMRQEVARKLQVSSHSHTHSQSRGQ